MHSSTEIENCLLDSAEEARELYIYDTVPRLAVAPTAQEFIKKWVMPNRPFIVEGGASDWPALKKWSSKYLRDNLHDKVISVAVTPNGRADAVENGKFTLPEEREMTFASFLDRVDEKEGDVFYVQKQNSNLTHDLPELLNDVGKDICWASEAFGTMPDAVNFWMGSARAVTSMHKDHYENLYVVIAGSKEFILHPPIDRPFIPHHGYPQAQYSKVGDKWTTIDLPGSGSIPWVSIDPVNPDVRMYPMYKNAKQLRCVVNAGDLFYLPALWFHHVSQIDGTIAVNYWYDMEFDVKYSYFQALDKLSKMLGR